MKEPPEIKLEIIHQFERDPSFLTVQHYIFKAHYPDGKVSDQFNIDVVRRSKLDAATIVAFYWSLDKTDRTQRTLYVYLRSCVRPALLARKDDPNGWELPAGLIDPGETPQQTAARECKEELGFDYPDDKFHELAHHIHSSVGMTGERIYFYSVEVDPNDQGEPTLDGSPMEEGADIIAVPIKDALKWCEEGQITDSKTVIGLMRLMYL